MAHLDWSGEPFGIAVRRRVLLLVTGTLMAGCCPGSHGGEGDAATRYVDHRLLDPSYRLAKAQWDAIDRDRDARWPKQRALLERVHHGDTYATFAEKIEPAGLTLERTTEAAQGRVETYAFDGMPFLHFTVIVRDEKIEDVETDAF